MLPVSAHHTQIVPSLLSLVLSLSSLLLNLQKGLPTGILFSIRLSRTLISLSLSLSPTFSLFDTVFLYRLSYISSTLLFSFFITSFSLLTLCHSQRDAVGQVRLCMCVCVRVHACVLVYVRGRQSKCVKSK